MPLTAKYHIYGKLVCFPKISWQEPLLYSFVFLILQVLIFAPPLRLQPAQVLGAGGLLQGGV